MYNNKYLKIWRLVIKSWNYDDVLSLNKIGTN